MSEDKHIREWRARISYYQPGAAIILWLLGPIGLAALLRQVDGRWLRQRQLIPVVDGAMAVVNGDCVVPVSVKLSPSSPACG